MALPTGSWKYYSDGTEKTSGTPWFAGKLLKGTHCRLTQHYHQKELNWIRAIVLKVVTKWPIKEKFNLEGCTF